MPGLHSIGASLEVTWTVLQQKTTAVDSMKTVLKTMSAVPAALLGLSHIKGGLSVGKSADIVIFNPHSQGYSKVHESSIYHKELLLGVVEAVFLKGKLVYKQGKASAQGEFLN